MQISYSQFKLGLFEEEKADQRGWRKRSCGKERGGRLQGQLKARSDGVLQVRIRTLAFI